MLTVKVCSGIGDIHWVLQKLYPLTQHEDKRGLKVYLKIADSGPRRALPFIDMLPWIRGAEYSKEFNTLDVLGADQVETIPDEGEIFLQTNTWLESGKNLVDWLPDLHTPYWYPIDIKERYHKQAEEICKDNPIGIFPASLHGNLNYQNIGKGWSAEKWLELCLKLEEDRPIIIMGAEWDRGMIEYLEGSTRNRTILQSQPLGLVLACIQRLKYFYSFPSGLGIISELLGTPTTMFMSSHLEKMIGTWGDPGNKRHKVCLFPETVDELLEENASIPSFSN